MWLALVTGTSSAVTPSLAAMRSVTSMSSPMRVDAVGAGTSLGYTSGLRRNSSCGVVRAVVAIEFRGARGPPAFHGLAQAPAACALRSRNVALVQRRGRGRALPRPEERRGGQEARP